MNFDLTKWLANIGLPEYAEAFLTQGVDEPSLQELSDAELRELGVDKMGHRKTILREAAKLASVTATGLSASKPTTESSQSSAADNLPLSPEPATFGSTDTPLKLFLSYGRDDHVLEVKALLQALRLRGHQVWFDEEQLATGLDWEQRIEKGLQWCDKVVLTMTPHSVRRPDGYCLNEIAKAMEQQKLIVPVLLVEIPNGAPTSICRIQYLDWRDAMPAAEKTDRFMQRLKRLCEAIELDKLDFEGGQQRLQRHLQPLNYDGDIRRHVARFEGRNALERRLREWLNEPNAAQVLWLTGSPGLGKSAIAAWLAHRWAEAGAMHFCQAGHMDKADPVRAVLSIAYQLSQHLDLYRARLSNLELEREAQKNDARTLFDTLLVGPLARQYPAPDKPCVVILDGLDEATRADGSNPLAELVAADWARLPRWLRLIVSSRPDAEVQQWLSGVQTMALSGQDPEQQADLLTYLERQLLDMGRPVGIQVLQRILQASEGAFHYTVLLLEEVRQGRCNPEDPVDLPAGMNQIYLQALRRRFADAAQYRAQCRPLLALMLASPEPLPLQVMAKAEGIDTFEVRERLLRLGSMVAIEQAEAGHGPEWDTARPAHASLRSWLTGLDERRMPLARDFAVQPSTNALAAQVLTLWDEAKQAEGAQAQPHGYLARALWPLLQTTDDREGMDRIAFDLSLYWEHRELQLAIAPGKHAAQASKRQADESLASEEQLERAANCAGHLGDLYADMGQSSQAMEAYWASSTIIEHLTTMAPFNARWQQYLSVIYHRIGGVLKSQGNLTGVLDMFHKSLNIAERLVTQDSLNAEWQKNLGSAHHNIGGVLESQGDLAGAMEMFQESLFIHQRLAAQDPLNAEWQSDLSVAKKCIGWLLESQGDLTGAMEMFQMALIIAERLAAQDSLNTEWQKNLGNLHSNIAGVLLSQGDLAGAMEMFQESLVIRQRLAAQDSLNAEWQKNLGSANHNIGGVLESQGDLAGALEMFQESLFIRQRLAAQDPLNAEWQQDLCRSYNRIGEVLESQGNLTGALEMFQKDLAIVERLAAQDPLNADWQLGLSFSYNRIGRVLESQGDLASALQVFQKDLAIAERLAAQDPLNARWRSDLAYSLHQTGECHEQLGLLFEAAYLWRRELEVRTAMASQTEDPAEAERELASCLNPIGGALEAIGDINGACDAYRDYLGRSQSILMRDPGNATKQRNVAVGQANLARSELAQGHLDKAQALHTQASQTFQALRDADDLGSQHDWAAALALGAEIARDAGDDANLVALQDKLATLELGSGEPEGRFRKRFMPLIERHLLARLARRQA
jgi:tetratricopeptide (TPR) repeat protein